LTDRTASAPRKTPWRSSLGLLALCATLNLCLASSLYGEMLKVAQPHERLYQSPDFNSQALGPVPSGATVRVLQKTESWFQVEYQGQVGWLHRKAFPWSPSIQSGHAASPLRPVPPGTGQPGWGSQPSGQVRPALPPTPLGHPGLLQGNPVQGTRSDEIATGGKAVPPPAKGLKKSRPKRARAQKLHKTNPQKKPALPHQRGGSGEGKN
jgi:uncharacterized protein YgiM (DUF1202 family)